MSAVTITVDQAYLGSVVNYTSKAKRVKLRQVSGEKRSVTFPIGPLKVSYAGLGLDYMTIERPGDIAFLEASAKKARTLSMSVVISATASTGTVDVENILAKLELIAGEDVDCVFTYGVRAMPFRVRITKFSYDSARRNMDGTIIQANADIQLTERPTREIGVVSLDAIEYTPTNTTSSYSGGSSGSGTDTGGDDEVEFDPKDTYRDYTNPIEEGRVTYN